MTRIGFIGLGTMGAPMARNLVDAGHEVTGYNRSPGSVHDLVEHGGRAAQDVAGAVRDADVVITVLPDSPDVEEVVLGEGGVLASCTEGTILIDMSTVSPATSRTVARRGADVGVRTLDAPVSGGEKGARDGTLAIMVGGAAADVEAVRELFDVMGSTVVHVGPSGAGQTVKAANQLVVAGNIQLVAEALSLLDAQGVDLDRAVTVLGGGLAASTVLDRKGASMIAGDYTPSFRAALHHKDLGILLAAARESRVPLPVGALLAQQMTALVAQGHGDLDHSALLLVQQALAGQGTPDAP